MKANGGHRIFYVGYPKSLTFLEPHLSKQECYLAKLGGYVDGGYVVDYRACLMTSHLVSGGVGSNVHFESDFLDINPDVLVTMIDPTVSVTRMLLRAGYHCFRKNASGLRSFSDTLTYLRVAQGATLVRRYLGDGYNVSQVLGDQSSGVGHKDPVRDVFIKLDIEGAEYGILDDLLGVAHRLNGMCIEFHGLNDGRNVSDLRRFVEELRFHIVHININDACMADGIPSVVEISFSPREAMYWPERFGSASYLRNSRLAFAD